MILIIAVLIYAIVLKAHTNQWLNWVWAGILAPVIAYLFSLVVRLIIVTGYGYSPAQAITLDGLITLGLQIVFALAVFYWLDQLEQTYLKWTAVSVAGGIGLVIVIPRIAKLLIELLA